MAHKPGCRCKWHGQPLEEILVAGRRQSRWRVKARIMQAGLLPNRCADCEIGPEYNGKPLMLQLDHINGDGEDWRLENLRLLCPNCHSQSPTFCGRNHKRRRLLAQLDRAPAREAGGQRFKSSVVDQTR